MSANISHFPDLAADFVTILRHPTNRMAKVWRRDGSISQYDDAKRFRVRRQPVNDLRGLSDVLTDIQADPHACIIRGDYRRGEFATIEQYAQAHDVDHKPTGLRRILDLLDDAPHHWVLIDVDRFTPLLADPVHEPEEAIAEYIEQELPSAFHGASFHWQMSNSAGYRSADKDNTSTLKVHLWFWLAEEATGAQLRQWAKATDASVDRALFNANQAHYTANPVFEDGLADPVPRRSGFWQGARDVVMLDLSDLPADAVKPTRMEHLAETMRGDPVVQALEAQGMVKSQSLDGKLNIVCPFEADHKSGAGAESSTIYYPAYTGGYEHGHFSCLHDGCKGRTHDDFRRALGVLADPMADFEALADEDEPDTAAEAPAEKPKNRFAPLSIADFARRPAPRWIIKGVLPRAELAVIFGESGAGKSFFALDLAAAIARGVDWRGKRTKAGRVVYVVAEGAGGFRNRVVAYAQRHELELDDIPIDVIPAAPNLLEKDQAVDVAKAILERGRADVVFVDTLAQTTPGANENAGEDMGQVLAHCKGIHRATGALVVLIHHAGKDLTKGARGWSGLRAACDAEIEVSRGAGVRTVRMSKQKDGDDNEEWHFGLDQVVIGPDEDGDPITSCVMNYDVVQEAGPAQQKGDKPKGRWESMVMRVLGEWCEATMAGHEVEALKKEVAGRMPAEGGSGKDRRGEYATRAIGSLASRGFFTIVDGEISFNDAPF